VRFDLVGEEDLRHTIQLDQRLPVLSHAVLLQACRLRYRRVCRAALL
jgi:hypothetical protein